MLIYSMTTLLEYIDILQIFHARNFLTNEIYYT